jgi:hypothetical protein
MKKLLWTSTWLFLIGTCVASAQFRFVKVFPDTATTTGSFSGAINNGIAVDPAGKIWVQSYTASTDSFGVGLPKTGAIYVFNPDGTKASFSPIKILRGTDQNGFPVTDTLNSYGYGLTVDPSTGNILSVKGFNLIWKIDYKTGAGIKRIISPIPGYGGSLATPAVDKFGEVFIAPVYPGSAVKILNSDFTSAGTVLNSSFGYMRCIAVSPNGNDVYVPSFNPAKFYLYHSDNGSLGPYVFKDSMLSQLVVESVAWHPKTGDLWASSGNVTSGLPAAPFSPYRWYAYNLSTKRIVDSIVWNGPVDIDPRPRGIAFSPTGDTAYVAAFTLAWYIDPCVEMFVKKTTQPSPPSLACISPPTVAKGNDFTVEIRIDDSNRNANLFGVGFDINFSNTSFVDYISADTTGCYLGPNLLYILTPDDPNGKVSVGLSRKAPASGVPGGGTVLKLKFHVSTNAPDNGTIIFSPSNISANDPNGTSIVLTTVACTTTVTPNLNVWPGDADNNGVANQNDVLPIGVYWAKIGLARSGASTQWLAQSSIPWTPSAATFADANGDGIVNQADVLPIGLNWGKIHSLNKTEVFGVNSQKTPPAHVLGTPVLRATGPTSVRGKTTFDVNVTLGDTVNPASSLFGISFVLDFANSKSIIQVMEVTPGTFLGNDIIFFPQMDDSNGTVAIGLTRKSGANDVTGFGQLVKVKFQVVNNTSTSSFMFTTRDIAANDASGNLVAVLPSSSSVLVSAGEMNPIPFGFRLEQNYPNPFNPSTRIAFSVPRTTRVQLRILDALGREVTLLVSGERPAGVYETQWQAGSLPSGIYFYRLQAGEFVETKKMILLR